MKETKTKQLKRAYKQYRKSDNYDLRDCYGRFSEAKAQAWDYCIDLYLKYNGYALKVIGHNSMQFSAGFVGEIADAVTGELKKAFFYITRDYDRYILLDDCEVLQNEEFYF